MKNSPLEATRWLRQAQHDLRVSTKHLRDRFFSDACFMSEQTAQKALKAFLFFKGERFVPLHSVLELVERCVKYESKFEAWIESGQVLDKYYIPARYPDAAPGPSAPYELFTQWEAEEAVQRAKGIVNLVSKLMK